MITCAQCKYWKTQPPGPPYDQAFVESGMCGLIAEGTTEAGAETFNYHGEDSGLITDASFGCNRGQAK